MSESCVARTDLSRVLTVRHHLSVIVLSQPRSGVSRMSGGDSRAYKSVINWLYALLKIFSKAMGMAQYLCRGRAAESSGQSTHDSDS